jgi:outer membrane protein insertion porin family
MKKLYEKYGYPDTQVKYVLNIDEVSGRGDRSRLKSSKAKRSKSLQIEFIGATAFSRQKSCASKSRLRHWMFSWLTGSGVFKQDDFDDDRDRSWILPHHGYLDFEIKDVKLDHPTPNTMIDSFLRF